MAKGIKFRQLAKKASFEFMSEGEAKAACAILSLMAFHFFNSFHSTHHFKGIVEH